MAKNWGENDLRALEESVYRSLNKESEALQLRILAAYRDAKQNVLGKIDDFYKAHKEITPSAQRLAALKRHIDSVLVELGDEVEDIVRLGKNLGVEAGGKITSGSAEIMELSAPTWNTFLLGDALPYIRSQSLARQTGVKTYNDLATFFSRQEVKYFDQLIQGVGTQHQILLNLKWGTAKEIAASVAKFKELGIAWAPLAELERVIAAGVVERIGIGELVTRLRRDVWHLPPGARNPRITYQALRLARSETAHATWLSKDAWGRSTEGIVGIKRVFGGGACPSGICLQAAGYYPYNGTNPEPIPLHPNCQCYDVFVTASRAAEFAETGQEVNSLAA